MSRELEHAIFSPLDRSRMRVEAIRVMLGKMPAILRDILEETFASQRDMMLVGISDPAAPRSMVAATVAASRPDVLVVGVDRQDWTPGFVELFVDNPDLHILAIGDDARSATMHELYIRRWHVPALSPPAIVAAVRATREVDDEPPRLISDGSQ